MSSRTQTHVLREGRQYEVDAVSTITDDATVNTSFTDPGGTTHTGTIGGSTNVEEITSASEAQSTVDSVEGGNGIARIPPGTTVELTGTEGSIELGDNVYIKVDGVLTIADGETAFPLLENKDQTNGNSWIQIEINGEIDGNAPNVSENSTGDIGGRLGNAGILVEQGDNIHIWGTGSVHDIQQDGIFLWKDRDNTARDALKEWSVRGISIYNCGVSSGSGAGDTMHVEGMGGRVIGCRFGDHSDTSLAQDHCTGTVMAGNIITSRTGPSTISSSPQQAVTFAFDTEGSRFHNNTIVDFGGTGILHGWSSQTGVRRNSAINNTIWNLPSTSNAIDIQESSQQFTVSWNIVRDVNNRGIFARSGTNDHRIENNLVDNAINDPGIDVRSTDTIVRNNEVVNSSTAYNFGDSSVLARDNIGQSLTQTLSATGPSLDWHTPVFILDGSSNNVDAVLPDPTKWATDGAEFIVLAEDSTNDTLVSPNGTENINGANSEVTLANTFDQFRFVSDGTDWYAVELSAAA